MSTFLPAVPYFPNLPSYTQAEFLALFDRLLPQYYLEPMKEIGPGYEYLQAVAKVMERVSQSVAHMGDAAFIATATGGARATATIEISRTSSVFGAVTLLPGTLVGTEEGFLYQTLTTVTFGPTDTTPKEVEVEAAAKGWDWNKPGEKVSASNEVLAGSIIKLVSAVVPEDGSFDPTLKIRQLTDATGGISPSLDGLGVDRGIYRQGSNAVVEFDISAARTTPVVWLPGTRVAASDGYLYQLIETLTIPANVSGEASKTRARAIPVVRPDAYAEYGAISSPVVLNRWGSPAYTEGTVVANQVLPYTRESDESYRARVALLPLVVTPNNIELLLNQTIGSVTRANGRTYSWREVWDIRFQSTYSQHSLPADEDLDVDFPVNTTLTQAEVNVPVAPYNSNIFVYDYEPEDPLSNRYLGPQLGMIVFDLPEIAGQELAYAGLAELLDGATAAGISLGYILTSP